MNSDQPANPAVEQQLYVFLLSQIHEPGFIILNRSGTSYLINKKLASLLKYRSIKEFYQTNENIYRIFAGKEAGIFNQINKNPTLTRQITIRDKQGHQVRFELQLRCMGDFSREDCIVSGIFIDEVAKNLDQTVLSFLNSDEFLDEAMFILDFKGNMLTANRKIHHIDFFANLMDKNVNLFSLIDESDRDKLTKRLQSIRKGFSLPPVEYKLISPDNKLAYIKLYSRLITYKKKKALLALIRDITLRKQTEKRLIQAIIETEENERHRFASDLHDELGPFFSGIKLYINELKSLKNEPRKQVRLLNYLIKMTDEASDRIRTISSNLTPNNMIELGLAYSVKKMIDQINKAGQVNINLKIKGKEEQMENPFILSLYHIVLELINNGMKHSGSRSISLILWFRAKSIQLVYLDEGKGFDLNNELKMNKGIGLKSILNRIIFYQGTYKFIKKDTQGIRFELNFPKSSF